MTSPRGEHLQIQRHFPRGQDGKGSISTTTTTASSQIVKMEYEPGIISNEVGSQRSTTYTMAFGVVEGEGLIQQRVYQAEGLNY